MAPVVPPSDLPAGWVVRGEGGANVVLGYEGDDPMLLGTVLRVRKHSLKTGNQDREFSAPLEEEVWAGVLPVNASSEELEVAYMRDYLTPLLGHEHVHAGEIVPLPQEVEQYLINKNILPAQGEGSSKTALLLPDHTTLPATCIPDGWIADGPALCVEVKPKWGFLPSSSHIKPAHNVKTQVSRFTMHSLLRHVKDGTPLSLYDPLDLYSGDANRMKTAIKHLLDVPGNNLRVFANGTMVFGGRPHAETATGAYGDTGRQRAELEELLDGVCQRYFNGAPDVEHSAVDHFVHAVVHALMDAGVLQKVRKVQAMDELDVEATLPLYQALLRQDKEAAASSEPLPYGIATRSKALEALRKYLTSATAKDCGVMVTLQPVIPAAGGTPADTAASSEPQLPSLRLPRAKLLSPSPNSCSSSLESAVCPARWAWACRVALVDLGLKPLRKLQEHYELDRRILECTLSNEHLLPGQAQLSNA